MEVVESLMQDAGSGGRIHLALEDQNKNKDTMMSGQEDVCGAGKEKE